MGLIANAVRKQKIAAVIAVHDINLAIKYSNRFLLLKNKKIWPLQSKEDITAQVIREVYGVDVAIGKVKDQTVVVPLEACV